MCDKLNIIYHFRVRGSGAEGVHIAGIVNGFRALGHRVKLISPTGIDPTVESAAAVAEKKPSFKTVVLHKLADALPQPFFELMELCYGIVAIMRLWRAVSREKVDFIYERYAFFNMAGAFVARRKNIPLVVEVNELSGHKRIRGQFFIRLCSMVETYVLRQAGVVITVSDFLNTEVCRKVDLNRTRVVTIPNGVPESWLQRNIDDKDVVLLRKQHGLEGKKVICFIGGLVHWHNFDFLIEAVADVQRCVADVVMMFVGAGPLERHIREKADALGISSNGILLVGKVAHCRIPLYLRLSDVAVIPATNDFRSPIKLFEYMAMALPIVAPRKPAIETAVTHNTNGLLFEPGNREQLAEQLTACLTGTKFASTLGKNARRVIEERFTWQEHAKSVERIMTGGVCRENFMALR